ncbi:hypothetical protein [Xenorhabdus szentirmaii]|uniref:Uncharacterized protein n=1 Tax=Xenorhabdus szentirmaii TaxID=290112 RepID=A0AAW3YYW8_9GAMM|nr:MULTISPECIES: hypothetical protein [Xenorhabdus]MBD2781881.1 hypothetical protein [Xenorhabdus sp. 38]MBD2792136.1 hypothetical protein [Xenorhabdus sp. CUL]MBD2801977.1 hypothetical protein [Xenorhabdus sp. M]MBD2803231.1 hypothetical protein [Xenorhabdus sp. ZM]MBD2821896.1 hypothetical protein [Xenorhabdus sp. 42]
MRKMPSATQGSLSRLNLILTTPAQLPARIAVSDVHQEIALFFDWTNH